MGKHFTIFAADVAAIGGLREDRFNGRGMENEGEG